MKKSFAVLLAVSLLFGCFSPGIALEETADDQAISLPFSMEAGFLKSIGVIDGSFDLTASKTRGEFTKLLALMMFLLRTFRPHTPITRISRLAATSML